MALLVVRHAHAGRRRDWDGHDSARPLSPKGRHQADSLVRLLASYPIERILSSPSTRCVQTVEPLAQAFGLAVEIAEALGEGNGAREPLRLARSLADVSAVLCSHGDMIPLLLDALAAEDGLPLPPDYPCAKGSTWILQARDSVFVEATYLPPTN
jgi:broad specificity phosphatase PhoE